MTPSEIRDLIEREILAHRRLLPTAAWTAQDVAVAEQHARTIARTVCQSLLFEAAEELSVQIAKGREK